MQSSTAPPPLLLLLLTIIIIILQSCPSISVVTAAAAAGENPFTPKAYAIRYWTKKISNDLIKPSFLLDKASPLTAADAAAFTKLADDPNSLSTRFTDFCTKANLFCLTGSKRSFQRHNENVNFTSYLGMNFTNYGTKRIGGADAFKSYSDEANIATDNFHRYGHSSVAHEEEFTSYGTDVNQPDHSFNGYGGGATGGGGEFNHYQTDVNLPSLNFKWYSINANARSQKFTEYSNDANSGKEEFILYGKSGNGDAVDFSNYGNDSNVIDSRFTSYGHSGNGGRDSFTSYGHDSNDPQNTFRNYGSGGNGGSESFTSYRNESNIGDDDFRSYGRHSNAAKAEFKLYGQIGGGSRFAGYGKNASAQMTDFKVYGPNTTFKTYNEDGVVFASYANESETSGNLPTAVKGKKVKAKPMVVAGNFFREEMLMNGNIMPMPDITDQMPKRSFLPRSLVSKLPCSTSKIENLKTVFHARNSSGMRSILVNSLNECERAPSPGETKQCVGSIEDMIEFATSVLGRNVTVRTTENTQGSNGNILLGEIKEINGGEITKSVSCHQSLFPYLLYYCHSVPKVRVYEADILDPNSKAKINRGVAICHLDTSSWSPGHGAFLALGSRPGEIEVCHWIFENDMNWTKVD